MEIIIPSSGSADEGQIKQFHELVPSVEHRAPLLHHVGTYGTPDALYSISSLKKIIYVVRVVFQESSSSAHSKVLKAVVQKELGWIYGETELPSFQGFDSRDFA